MLLWGKALSLKLLILLLLKSSRARFGKLSNTFASTLSNWFPLRQRSVKCSIGVGKESSSIREILFPVRSRNVVLVGKECGIDSKSWFWHFTVSEEHRHLSGQSWQDSTAEERRSKSKRIVTDVCVSPRLSPRSHTHGAVNGRILDCENLSAQTARKDSFPGIPVSRPPPSSTGIMGKFFSRVSHVCIPSLPL